MALRQSMTGFATRQGETDTHGWSWDIRSVNARGLDLRLRVPDWVEGLEALCRTRVSARIARGSVSLNLRLNKSDAAPDLEIDTAQVARITQALAQIEETARTGGVTLSPVSAADILVQKGVWVQKEETDENASHLLEALAADLDHLLDAFVGMRQAEGQALSEVLTGQIDEVESLVLKATDVLADRKADMEQSFRSQVARLVSNTDGLEEARLIQELAILAVKSDVTEEIDRLHAHIKAARALLAQEGPIGRKFDFLTQEFNREANTLCSKAQSTALTTVGLSLKTVIDQMREQVQNVE